MESDILLLIWLQNADASCALFKCRFKTQHGSLCCLCCNGGNVVHVSKLGAQDCMLVTINVWVLEPTRHATIPDQSRSVSTGSFQRLVVMLELDLSADERVNPVLCPIDKTMWTYWCQY